jgi:dTDP-4-amino-4,6-dideoxygalactose transaminase
VISYSCLERQYQVEKDLLIIAFERVACSGQFILGSIVEELEQKLAEFCGVKFCVTLNSGTDALILGMMAAGIKKGDQVITPPNSFVASTAAIIHLGAVPVFVDVDEDQNINISLIEQAITEKTKAIMPVHLTGRICNMDEIEKIANKYNLLIIEDAAQSFGSIYKNKKSGSFGKIGCFSAHPLKAFNACGDAGFLTTNDINIAERIKRLRAHGLIDRNTIQEWGCVSRLDTLQASILLMRLQLVEQYIKQRRKNVEFYRESLDPKYVFIPPCKDYEYNSFQTFVVQVDDRDSLQLYLKQNGVESSIHYPIPIHLQIPAKKLGYKSGDFPVTEKQASHILSLPISQFLKESEIQYISSLINDFYCQKNT